MTEVSPSVASLKYYENELILMKRESFDELRGNGRLEKFLYSLSNEVLDSLLFK